MHEYDCRRCGVRVVSVVGVPHPEIIYCASCRFIENVLDPVERRRVAEFLDARNPMFEGGFGPPGEEDRG